jgi:hypothetical protein
VHRDHKEGSPSPACAVRNHSSSSSVLSVSSVVNPIPAPAGHGVDRSESNAAAGSATVLPFRRPTPARSRCRNQLPRVRS